MGKKKNIADQVRQKKKGQEKKTNPFEVKINRVKHNVLGRKLSKHDKGMPGVARSKAIKRRKETLLKEYQTQHKSNKFVDKRFGENDASLSIEDKMLKRYAMERAKMTAKNRFNLNEDEELTHYGQSLAEIEKFDDPIISDEEENDDDRRAEAKLVAEHHFGGFMKKKWEPPGADGAPKTWKERMEEVISQSKKAKYERQMEKEKSVQLTEELDEQWKNLHRLINPKTPKTKEEEDMQRAMDEYDLAVNQLKFELKGKATDRMKTEEELAKEEKERLEKLEADRKRRMKGIVEDQSTPTHKSADDLDDGFALDNSDFDYVSYKDGKLLHDSQDEASADADEEEDVGEGEVEENTDDEEEESDAADDDEDDDDDDEEDAGEDDEEEEEDDYEDLESDDASDNEVKEKELKPILKKGRDLKEKVERKASEMKTKDGSKFDEQKRKEMMEKAKEELPFTFDAPESYDALLDLLEGHSEEEQLVIIERIRKCHHPSLAEGNKEKLEVLFGHLVHLYEDLLHQSPPHVSMATRLLSHLYTLSQMSPVAAAITMVDILTERHVEFAEVCTKKAGRGLFPGLDMLLLFKLVGQLFPTSDFYHHVTTPAMLFMAQILAQCPVCTGQDVAAGIFLANLCLEYVGLSKRYVPEVINFLQGLLFMAADKEPNKLEKVVPPFKPVGNNINLLHVKTPVDSIDCKWSVTKMLVPDADQDIFTSDSFKASAIHQCVVLLNEFSKLYASLPSYKEVFTPVIYMCQKLPTQQYPDNVQTSISEFLSCCKTTCNRRRECLIMQKKKPKPLKMFEPKMEETFDGRKKGKRGTRDFNEKQKLLHKHKKEMKGARRELKKDTQFLARQRLREVMELDAERKRKVKQIYAGLANQEGEYKKMKLGKAPDS